MRVLVTGGRGFIGHALVSSILNGIHDRTPIRALIHGAAVGADRLAGAWVTDNNVAVEVYKPNWELH